eukprot:4214660-Amphidinium_carterae.1
MEAQGRSHVIPRMWHSLVTACWTIWHCNMVPKIMLHGIQKSQMYKGVCVSWLPCPLRFASSSPLPGADLCRI